MFQIVGKRFSVEEFAAYVDGIKMSTRFAPRFVVVHNTASPSLADRPHGFTEQHMANFVDYYGKDRGWSGGPHLFIDDNGIWVFNPLDRPGVHSPSWNLCSWGMEHLGDFDTDDPLTGRGAKVMAIGTAATAILLTKIGQSCNASTVRFHREDRLTSHQCPGNKLSKGWFLNEVFTHTQKPKPTGWTVIGPTGATLVENLQEGPSGTGLVRSVAEGLGATVNADGTTKKIVLAKV